jgi:hypothetical protein
MPMKGENWPMTMKGWIYPMVVKVTNNNERMDLSHGWKSDQWQ